MKITRKVIEQYQELCPVSTAKCNSLSEIEYKITRAIELGQLVEIRNDGSVIIQYYKNCFVIKDGKVIHMYKCKRKSVKVSEKVKKQHFNLYHKVCV